MKHQFDLVTQAWIPLVRLDGAAQAVSLREALVNAPAYRGVSANLPHSNAAVMRLLLAILKRVFGPPDADAWEVLWKAQTFDAGRLDAYFQSEGVRDRFDLFDARHPFMQQRHPLVNEKPAQDLLQLVGGGDTFTLFDHVMDATPFTLTPPEAALMLVTLQAFGLAGLCHPQHKLTYTDAPCSRAVIFFVEGKTLFETLMLNLTRYMPERSTPLKKIVEDRPAWEADDPYLPERTRPLGELDGLTWPNRRVLLIPEERDGQSVVARITAAPGLVLGAEVRNPMVHYRIDQGKKAGDETVKILRFSEGRALWRDSYTLLDMQNPNTEPPRALSWVNELMAEGILPARRLQLAAYGMCTEPGKAKVHFYRGEHFEFDDRILQDRSLAAHLNTALTRAEDLRRELWMLATRLATTIVSLNADLEGGRKPDPKDVQNLVNHWDAEGLFWNRLELPFYTFLDRLPDAPEAALQAWDDELRAAFRSAYQRTANGLGESKNAFKAAALTQGMLNWAIKKVFPSQPQEN